MCTATWWNDAGRYELFFSRDERLDRSPGIEPKLHKLGDVSYICPRDPDGGGTWLLVNSYGLSLCLLNQYPDNPAARRTERISRGRLVEGFAGCESIQEVEKRIQAIDLDSYDGFLLLAIDRGGAFSFRWDTHDLIINSEAAIDQPVTSSSYLSEEVIVTRQHLFAEMVVNQGDPSPEKLDAFHRHFIPEASTHSVFMQRYDSQTVSLCQVVVSRERISTSYAPKVSGEPRFEEPVQLEIVPENCH